jgi:hypothetical protein
MAVVDHEFKVHNIENLRIVDGSVMPEGNNWQHDGSLLDHRRARLEKSSFQG